MRIDDELLRNLGQDGWDGLRADPDRFQRDMAQLLTEARDEAAPIAAVFAGPEGTKALAWLVKKTLLRPPTEQEQTAKTCEEYAILKARREGQNGVIWMILQAIDVARGEATGGET